MTTAGGIWEKLGRYKYLLLMLLAGLALILLPTGAGGGQTAAAAGGTEAETRLEAVLGAVSGVGRASVLCSEAGVVVVCDGADAPQVRLDIVRAVVAYTGLGSDRVTVLKREGTD